MDFVIGHQSASSQFNNLFTLGEVPILSRAGEVLSDGYGELASNITTLISDAEEKGSLHVDVHSKESEGLTVSIGKLLSARKNNWIDNYNANVENGIIKLK